MKEYLKNIEEVLKDMDSSLDGLSKEEAISRYEAYGPNRLEEKKNDGILKRFIRELSDPMLIILMIAAVLSVVTSAAAGSVEWSDAIIILVVVLINAVLGVVQESKAERR